MRFSIHKGTARLVFIIGKYAIKIARTRLCDAWHYRRWGELVEGVKANLSERRAWNDSHDPSLCRVLFADRRGLVLIMPYASPLTDDEFMKLELEYITTSARTFNRASFFTDFKRENYGILNKRTVKVDYES